MAGAVVGVALLLGGVGADAADPPEVKLAEALKENDVAAAGRLLEQARDLDVPLADGTTALHWAVFHDHTQITRQLLERGANAAAANRYGVTPLALACTNGNAAIVGALLDAGADANATLRGGETALMTAARTGKPGPMQRLLEHGAAVDATDRKGQTALMWAAAEGHVEAVDLLIEAGADVRQTLPSGFTPFFFAVREGRTEVVFRLIAAGIDVNQAVQTERRSGNGPRPGMSALLLAVENGHFELAARLLEAGADAGDARCGYTAMHAMTWVRKPLRGDGDPPPIGSGNLSSLDLVRALGAHGADVNARHREVSARNGRLNRTDATPFLLAAETGDLPYMTLLLELGADPSLTNADRCTPLLAAAGVGILGNGEESAGTEEDAIAAVRMLLELGADINAVDDLGNSAMHGAAFKSWPRLVRVLSEQGADVAVWNRPNQFGWTPLMIAQGHRPGNFRPSQETIEAVERVMHDAGVTPPGTPTADDG